MDQADRRVVGTSPTRRLRPRLVELASGAWRKVEGPVLAVAGALLIGALLMLLTGHNPIEAYREMVLGAVAGTNYANLGATLARAAPIVGMGLAAAVAFRAGFFNLGGEGQLVLGALAGALIALYVPAPMPLRLVLVMAGAMLTGALLAWLPTWAQFRFNVPLLISSLLLNYPARFLASYIVVHHVRDIPSGMPQTHLIPEALRFPLLMRGAPVHAGLFITLAVVLAAAFVIDRTVAGYELRMTGLNPSFARYSGVRLRRLGYAVMAASGALAGLVGAIEVLGVNYRYIDDALTSPQFAWVGLMAALLSGSSPLGVLVAGLFFSAIVTGGAGMERQTDVPRELSRMLQAIIILLIAARSSFRLGERHDEP
jgi:simple sugar transport system permease protein